MSIGMSLKSKYFDGIAMPSFAGIVVGPGIFVR